jgi:hypothetical protein
VEPPVLSVIKIPLSGRSNKRCHLPEGREQARSLLIHLKKLATIPDHVLREVFQTGVEVINCAAGRWKRKKNLDLWKRLDAFTGKHKVNWIQVHKGNK